MKAAIEALMAAGEKVSNQYYLSRVIKLMLGQGEEFIMKLLQTRCIFVSLIYFVFWCEIEYLHTVFGNVDILV